MLLFVKPVLYNICSPRGVRFDSISAVEEEINQGFHNVCNLDEVNHQFGNHDNQFDNHLHGLVSGQVRQFEQSLEEDWVPEELRELLQQDLQDEKEQNLQFLATRQTNDPSTDKQRRRQNITINIDPDALLKRVKRLRNPYKALYKKVLKRNHKLKLRAIRQLRRRKRRSKERGKGRERKNA